MASTEQLPSGRWRPIARDSAGKKIPKLGTYRRKSDAQHVADEAEVAARRRASVRTGALPASITWGAWWDLLAADREFESDTGRTEQSIVDTHLRPQWGAVALNEIDNVVIQDWIDSVAKVRRAGGTRYSPAYVRRIYGTFTMSMNAAIRRKILTASPLVGITLPKVRRKAKPFVSLDDADQLAGTLREDYADIVAFELETGLRPGELAGLHDDQVDVVRRVLTVRTVYVPRAKKMRGWPKDKDERIIPLTAKALAIYRRRVEGREMRCPCGVEHYDEPCTSDLVFRTKAGSVLNMATFSSAMKAAAVAAGLPSRSAYALRRGFATRLREAGADVFTMMELMGHASLEETRGYVQQGPGFNQNVRAVLGDPDVAGLPRLRLVEQHDEGAAAG